MENAARLRHGAGLYRDQTIETGTLSVLSFWHLQHCDTLTTCSSLLKECLLSPTDGIMSKDASSASQCDHVSRAPSENIIQNIQCSTQKESSKKWKYREFCEKCHLDCSVEPIACENPSVGDQNLQQIILVAICIFPHPDFTHFTFSDGDIWSSADNWRESLHPSGHNHQAQNIQTY